MTISELAKAYPNRCKVSDKVITVHNRYNKTIVLRLDKDKIVMTGHEGLPIHIETELFGIRSIKPIGGPFIQRGDILFGRKIKNIVKINKQLIHMHL